MSTELTEHFQSDEIECRCGCGRSIVRGGSILMLENARINAGIPFHVNSGYRCPKHPDYTETSSHMGYAYDLETKTGAQRLAVVYGCLLAGFRRIGIGEDFVHVDNDPNKPESIFHYYKKYKKKEK